MSFTLSIAFLVFYVVFVHDQSRRFLCERELLFKRSGNIEADLPGRNWNLSMAVGVELLMGIVIVFDAMFANGLPIALVCVGLSAPIVGYLIPQIILGNSNIPDGGLELCSHGVIYDKRVFYPWDDVQWFKWRTRNEVVIKLPATFFCAVVPDPNVTTIEGVLSEKCQRKKPSLDSHGPVWT